MNARLVFADRGQNEYTENIVLSFSFRKDAYVPYTKLNAICQPSRTSIDDYAEVKLYVGNFLVHHGCIDTLEMRKVGKYDKLYISSSGFTSQLCRNQIEPGLKTNVSLNSLMDDYCTLPYVTHEYNADASNYIYVRNNTAMWDAVASLSYKLFSTYPYIRGTNTVRITDVENPEQYVYNESDCLEIGRGNDYRRLASNYHMADINGDYGHYDLTDAETVSYKLVRNIYSELDMRFLYSPMQALEFRDKTDSRAMRRRYCVYSGYRGEDISDIMSVRTLFSGRIHLIGISGSSKGIITKVGTYTDKFHTI